MRDNTAKWLSRLHSGVFRLTGGVVGRRLVDNDMLLLTTTGRVTGRPHTVPLLYLSDREASIVFASWGGRDNHPEWYLNLIDDPHATVQIDGHRHGVRARTAEAEERDRWWAAAQKAYSGYATYQSRTERQIPVVILEPA
ncbi:MAG TPA: nitroreductase family deazaflavin-dependent oxidoreductase [Acidimicrobiia bacterium]|jgi:deazaflavin-dependent oxidoreductase (nitroreductase family)